MALFSPYAVERVYGKPFAAIAIRVHYDDPVADERNRKKHPHARGSFPRTAYISFRIHYHPQS
ncbi:ribonucleoside-diphosphate reductase 2 alpha subunit [Escherichia coli]|nr:ribonucleoside-diphosphate reductase 2 alpha subunit [Escherichia coli]